jgi:hypothetical protein
MSVSTTVYPWIASSPDNPNGMENGLGYNTEQEAIMHRDSMNHLLKQFDTDPMWNKDFWKVKPREWIVIKNPNFK